MSNILKTTVRIEVPVIFPFPPEENTGVSWDDLHEAAKARVLALLPPALVAGIEEMISLRGPGSSGHYSVESSVAEIFAAPHLSADFPPEPTK